MGHPEDNDGLLVAIKQIDMKNLIGIELRSALKNELMIIKLLNGNNTCGMIAEYLTVNNTYII